MKIYVQGIIMNIGKDSNAGNLPGKKLSCMATSVKKPLTSRRLCQGSKVYQGSLVFGRNLVLKLNLLAFSRLPAK